MSLTKMERAALAQLRRYVVLERAAIDPPTRARGHGYSSWGAHDETPVRPLAGADANLDYPSNEWTNDVAESLETYTASWILPLIEALLDQSGRGGKRSWTATEVLRAAVRREGER